MNSVEIGQKYLGGMVGCRTGNRTESGLVCPACPTTWRRGMKFCKNGAWNRSLYLLGQKEREKERERETISLLCTISPSTLALLTATKSVKKWAWDGAGKGDYLTDEPSFCGRDTNPHTSWKLRRRFRGLSQHWFLFLLGSHCPEEDCLASMETFKWNKVRT